MLNEGREDGQTLATALPAQQARCRKILEHVLEIGPAGNFLAAMLRASLARAEVAAASGDIAAMIQAFQDLSDFKE